MASKVQQCLNLLHPFSYPISIVRAVGTLCRQLVKHQRKLLNGVLMKLMSPFTPQLSVDLLNSLCHEYITAVRVNKACRIITYLGYITFSIRWLLNFIQHLLLFCFATSDLIAKQFMRRSENFFNQPNLCSLVLSTLYVLILFLLLYMYFYLQIKWNNYYIIVC